jgi:hypothetical protein
MVGSFILFKPRLHCHRFHPLLPPTVPSATPPSSAASCGFKRSTPPMELLVSSSSIHASPLLSSPFPSATATPNADALECPSNATAQEHHPQVALLPRASRCEVSPKPPHVVRHFHREHLIDGRHLWPPLTLTLYGPQADTGDLVSRLPLPFLSGRPAPPWIAPPKSVHQAIVEL